MTAMLVLVWLLLLMIMTMMKSDEIITAHCGDVVLLTSDLQGADIRWTHQHLVISLNSKGLACYHKRCELLRNGSLRFSQVQTADSGNYSLQVFDKNGKILKKRNFLLRVEDCSSSSSSSSSVLVPVLVCCFLLLLLLFIIFVRRSQRMSRTTSTTANRGQPELRRSLQENVYVVMHKLEDKKKLENEEESHYVTCKPVVSMETPITQQMSGDIEDIYV